MKISDKDTPDEKYWIEVGGDSCWHPYSMYKEVNRDDVEVINAVNDDDGSLVRWVLVRNGSYEVWVLTAAQDKYGYGLQSDEQVSATELEAIRLKHAAITTEESVTVDEARQLVDSNNPEQTSHGLVALYYAAQTDSTFSDEDVDRLRELMHEHTGQVDTNHLPTLSKALNNALGDAGATNSG